MPLSLKREQSISAASVLGVSNQDLADKVLSSLTPASQCHEVLKHIRSKGSITSVEAHELYRVYRCASRINDLRDKGILINSVRKVDLTGTSYVEYSLA